MMKKWTQHVYARLLCSGERTRKAIHCFNGVVCQRISTVFQWTKHVETMVILPPSHHPSPGQWCYMTVAHCGWKNCTRGENSTPSRNHGVHVSSELRWTGFILRGLRRFNGCFLLHAEISHAAGRIVASDCHHLVLHLAVYDHLPADFVVSRWGWTSWARYIDVKTSTPGHKHRVS